MNFYQHHLGDYLKDTAHLTMIEDGAYRRLIDLYYLHEQPLPKEQRQIYRLARAASPAERKAINTILEEYFVLTEGGYTHKRCDEEIVKIQGKAAKAKASAEARWGNKPNADAMRTHPENDANVHANASQTHTSEHSVGNASQEPITNNQEPITNKEHNSAADNSTVVSGGVVTAGLISKAMRENGIDSQPAHPSIIALAQQGVSIETIKAACVEATKAKPNERIGVGYVVAILQRWAKEVAKVNATGARPPQHQSNATTRDAGRSAAAASIGLGGYDHGSTSNATTIIDAATGTIAGSY
jgi:uncharacterized protein YdaU (DUF1376 family)